MTATAEAWGRAGVDGDDARLLEALRRGDVEPYAELWRRHLPSAYRVAHRYRGRASAEDIVGEASLRVFDRIRAGEGPTSNFRAYFLTVVKSVALDLGKADLRLVPTDTQDLEACATAVGPYDAAARVDQDLVRVAFGRLSVRDQQVLWHTAVQGAPAAVVGVAMGLSPNGVSAAAVRARDALRAAYLDAHADRAVAGTRSKECRWVLSQMGRYVRGKLGAKRRARLERHLQECRHAQVLAAELTEINLDLPTLMVPLIFVAAAHGAAAWCSAWFTPGHGGSLPQSLPVDPASSALAGVGASTTGLIAKAAGVVTAAVLGAGLSNTAGIGAPTGQPAQAHHAGASTTALSALAEPGGDGMPLLVIRGDGAATIGSVAGAVATVGEQPIPTPTSNPAAPSAGVPGEAGVAGGPASAVGPDASTRAVTTDAAPSTTGSSGTAASTPTAATSSVTPTVKANKTPPTQAPAAEPPIASTIPTSPPSPAPAALPPGQAKKTTGNAAPPPDTCKNVWSQAPACRTNTPP